MGIGTDIEEIERFLENIDNIDFLLKLFTQKELDYCFSKKNPSQHLAARFAGKEAIIKALSGIEISGITFTEIEIINNNLGVPYVQFSRPGMDNIYVKISLSHSSTISIAFALVMI